MSDDYETRHAVREANKIHLEDAYFNARPTLDFKINRNLFGAGFDRAWDTQEVRTEELKQQCDELEDGK